MNDSTYKILVGPPGPNFSWGCVQGLLALTSSKHECQLINSGNGFDDFDHIWTSALNAGEAGTITHVAMLHLDIMPKTGATEPIWLDTLIEEMDRLDLDFVSAVSALKDNTGLTSCAIGDPKDTWSPYRRLTMREIHELPETFTATDMGYPDFPLLHNSGCWVADMRKPLWYQADDTGTSPAHFAFPERVYRDQQSGQWVHARESEDWFFSRCLHRMKAKTAITRKVKLTHLGKVGFPNWQPWGEWEHDWKTASKWNVPHGPWDDVPGWFDFADLYQYQVNRVNGSPAKFVEVGAWMGKSTMFLADAIRRSNKAISLDVVDTWCGGEETWQNGCVNKLVREAGGSVYPQFEANVTAAGLMPFVNPIVSDSTEAAARYEDGTLDFVFIDADHSYQAVTRDLRAWWPKVKSGGVLAGHDVDEADVARAVADFDVEIGQKHKRACRSFVFQAV